jgi:hypothetical protein
MMGGTLNKQPASRPTGSIEFVHRSRALAAHCSSIFVGQIFND